MQDSEVADPIDSSAAMWSTGDDQVEARVVIQVENYEKILQKWGVCAKHHRRNHLVYP